MAKGWFRDLLTPMKPTETTSREWVNFLRQWVHFFREAFFILLVRLYLFFFIQFDPSESVDFFREAFFIPLLRLYLFFFLQFCLGYFLQFDPCDVVLSGYLCYLVITTLKKLIYLQNAETPSRAFFAIISIHAGILGLLLSLPSPRHFITSFDPPLFVLDGLLFSYYSLIGLSLLLSVQILKIIMKPMLKTLEISLKNKGIISVSSKFERGKYREQKPLDDSTKRKSFPDFDSSENKTHLVRSYQSGPVVSLSENKNKGEALKRECITKSMPAVEDLQQHCGGRLDAAAKSFRVWRPPDQLEGQTMQFAAHPNRNAQIASSQVPSANQDRRNLLASQVEAFFMGRVSESSNLAFPEYFDAAAPSQPVAPILTERQDTWSVKVKATYGDSIIKFLLLLTSGIKELMQEVSLTLDCVLGSFNFDYMDEDDYMDVDEDCFTTPCEFNGPPFTSEILQQYFGHKRKDVAASLGVSVSTFKRKCRQQGIMRWPNGMGSSGSVSKPPDQHGERNTSTACEMPSHYVQTGMEGELFGQNEMANVFPRDFMGGPIALDTESGLIMVSRPHDQHGERNTSTACGTPSRNVETGMEVEPVGQNQEANVFHQDFMYGPIALNTDGLRFPECSDAVAPSQPMATILDTIPHLNGGSSECAFQVKNQSTKFTANPYPNGLVDPNPQIALTQILSEDMERLEDRRNLLAPRKESLPEGHVFGSVNWTVRSCSDVALSQPMPTIPDTTGCSEYWRNSLALLEEHLLEENYGSINLTAPSCFDPGPSQPMHTIPHAMPTIPQMMPLLTERQDMSSVRLKATYGNTTIKFPLPSGFSELEEEVSKRLEFERGSFKLEYKDEEGDSVLIACDEDVRDYLRLLTSLGNQVVKLFVLDKVPNTTNFCDNCKSLTCKRP